MTLNSPSAAALSLAPREGAGRFGAFIDIPGEGTPVQDVESHAVSGLRLAVEDVFETFGQAGCTVRDPTGVCTGGFNPRSDGCAAAF